MSDTASQVSGTTATSITYSLNTLVGKQHGRRKAMSVEEAHFNTHSAKDHAMVVMAAMCTLCGAAWFALLALVGEWPGSWPALTYAICVGSTIVHFYVTRSNTLLIHGQLLLILLMPFTMHVVLGGFHLSSGVVLWSFLAPIGAILLHSRRLFAKYLVAFVCVLAVAGFTDTHAFPVREPDLPTWVIALFNLLNMFFPTMTVAMAVYVFARTTHREQERMKMLWRLGQLVAQPDQTLESYATTTCEEILQVLSVVHVAVIVTGKTRAEKGAVYAATQSGYRHALSSSALRKRMRYFLRHRRSPSEFEHFEPIKHPVTGDDYGHVYLRVDRTLLGYRFKVDSSVRAVGALASFLVSQLLSNAVNRNAERERLATKVMIDVQRDVADSRQQFLTSMSHEVRTPLNGIMGLLDLLKDTEPSDEQQELLNGIKDSSERLLQSVDEILDMSNLVAGRAKLQRAMHVDVRKVLSESAGKVMGRLRTNPEVEMYLGVSDEIPTSLYGDPSRLRTLFTNLLSNAYRFTDAGEVTFEVELVAIEETRVRLKCTCSDTGKGMSPETLASLWQPYEITKRKFGRTGLGLSLTSEIAQLMGGSVSASSQGIGYGSTFELLVTLTNVPVRSDDASSDEEGKGEKAEVAEADAEEEGADTTQTLKRRSILSSSATHLKNLVEATATRTALQECDVLVVDGHARGMHITRSALVDRGAQVAVVTSMEDACEYYSDAAAQRRINIVVVATTLPDGTGAECIRALKKIAEESTPTSAPKEGAPKRPTTSPTSAPQRPPSGAARKKTTAAASPFYVLVSSLSHFGRDRPMRAEGVHVLTRPLLECEVADALAKSARELFRSRSSLGNMKLQLLVVEDDRTNQIVVTRTLRKLGHTADVAENGQIGVEKAGIKKYDLILMDLHMPVMDGFEATRAIRAAADSPNQDTPICALTADVIGDVVDQCTACGMDDYSSKPIRKKRLGELCTKWAGGHHGDQTALRSGVVV